MVKISNKEVLEKIAKDIVHAQSHEEIDTFVNTILLSVLVN